MDLGTLPAAPPLDQNAGRRPRIALVLQGGGALGAYQGGVYEAMQEAGLAPDWIVGISIGAVNGAILAGNEPERRLARLEAFWREITSRPVFPPASESARPGTMWRKLFNLWSAAEAAAFGQPGFFTPRLPGPWLSPPGSAAATSFYDDAPLAATLRRLADFARIARGAVRYSVGAVDVASGEVAWFDSAAQPIELDHVMAAAAFPPALPMVRIAGRHYWDGGIVSNTPLQYLLDNVAAEQLLVIQVDLFSGSGPVPRDMFDVLARRKDIRYASRTRVTIDTYTEIFRQRVELRKLLRKIPDQRLDAAERRLKERLEHLPDVAIVHLTYRESAYEGEAKDYEFSAASMRRHWAAGHRDAAAALARADWRRLPRPDSGIVVHAPREG